MKTDPNNSFLKGMTQRSQLTGDPFEDFFNNLGDFQSPQEPQTLQLNPRQLWRWRLRAKTITVVVKTLVKPVLKSQKVFRRVRHQCHRNCPQGILTPVIGHWWDYPCHRNSQTVEPRTTRFWLENLRSENCRCGRPGSKNRRWRRST